MNQRQKTQFLKSLEIGFIFMRKIIQLDQHAQK